MMQKQILLKSCKADHEKDNTLLDAAHFSCTKLNQKINTSFGHHTAAFYIQCKDSFILAVEAGLHATSMTLTDW